MAETATPSTHKERASSHSKRTFVTLVGCVIDNGDYLPAGTPLPSGTVPVSLVHPWLEDGIIAESTGGA